MFKIGDFSKLGQVSTRMLRHYDQLGLLKPSQTDKFTGYRYYTIDQLSRLNRIIALKELGIPLEQIGQLLSEVKTLSAEKLRGMLLLRQAELAQELKEKQGQLIEVEARLHQIEHEGQPSPYEIVVKPLAAQAVASVRQVVPHMNEIGHYCQTMYAQLYDALRRHGLTPLQPELTLYHADEYTETDVDMETASPIQPRYLKQPPVAEMLIFRELPAEELAVALIYEGSLREITPAVLALLRYVGLHGYSLAGPLRELHLSGSAHTEDGSDPESMIVELQLPIRKLEA